jgi:hypothetical protein
VKPIATPLTDLTFKLDGGTEENDLPVTTYDKDLGGPCFGSTWAPSYEERLAIADGANIELIVWGDGHPPVAIRMADHRESTPSQVEVSIDADAVIDAVRGHTR